MIRFSRLRLSGFKSFVDPTEMAIEDGMTGIVGPNGCGKSNLVEALRWVMGEASARQMRGGEMDDVIFAGSANRPRRDVAEVAVVLDNHNGGLPAPFDTVAELEVVRRIGRGEGSAYRVNGRETRARDVQTMFADLASGARSTAIVGQGHIGTIINARPSERRVILEEAAGIAGLYPRRHEAELRLKAAETNLERLADVLATLDQQWQSLRRQARQAARYRDLSQRIRDAEAELLGARWRAAAQGEVEARAALEEIEGQVATLTGLAARAAARRAETQAALPVLREEEARVGAHLQRLRQAGRDLDAEEQRLAAERVEAGKRLAQTTGDLDRETARVADARGTIERLSGERRTLSEAAASEAKKDAEARTALAGAEAEAARIDGELARMMERVAAADAERGAALRRLSETEDRDRRLRARAEELEAELLRARADSVDPALLTSAEMDREEAEEHLAFCRRSLEEAEAARSGALAALETARERLQSMNAAQARLKAEAEGLRAALAQSGTGEQEPVIDALTPLAGYETALGAALGEDLSAPLDADAARAWRTLPPSAEETPALPGGLSPLGAFVTAPPALAGRLSQIGVVADDGEGERLLEGLHVGQRLVSRDGALWRWDGFVVKAGAPSAAAARLRQRARLRVLGAAIEDGALGLDEAGAETERAARAGEAGTEAQRKAREEVRRAEEETRRAVAAHLKLAEKAARAGERVSSLEQRQGAIVAEIAETEKALAAAREAVARFPGGGGDRERVAELKADAAEKRSKLIEARSALDRLKAEAADRARRIVAIDGEKASWDKRVAASVRQIEELEARRRQAGDDLTRLDAGPVRIAGQRQSLLSETAGTESRHRQASDALALGERASVDADRLAKEAETALAAAREERVRRESELAVWAKRLEEILARIEAKLGRVPDSPPEAGDEDATVEERERRLERLLGEREALGPVNLVAETEAADVRRRVEELTAERDDLLAAIAKLRHAIAEINREGRERLLASFETVDHHFRSLFVRLFGGGRAHLTLTDPADPLQAGLEIMASPPGKRLQMLSLLSGGEQTLTALALLFAVFMTNPAPICVLDEVDAPLDDANVDRFCDLVSEITVTSGTSFLVVTHHRMTMARMNRLFGVTMAERGVSTLVSVNLQRAAELSESTSP